jgi:biopolymer transport protein TolR
MRIPSSRIPMSEINVTPMVDVVLVLLIIFMVTAPLLEQGINVTLPKAKTSKDLGGSGFNLTLSKEHIVYLNGEMVTMKELRKKLSTLSNSQPILIRSDRSAYVSKLIELWDMCRDAGFTSIHIATITE